MSSPSPVGAPTTDQSIPARRILILDDDNAFASHLAAQLAAYGYEVRPVSAGGGLADALRQFPADAMLIDIMLDNGQTGPEVLGEVRNSGVPIPPVIFISANDDVDYRLAAVRAGGAGFFAKPFEIDPLIDILDGLTNRVPPAPYRIMIIDDSRATAEAHAQILRASGMQVTVVTDPLEAPALIRDQDPELLLLDMYMPGCNGDELALMLRQNPAHISLPIVFLSIESSLDRQMLALHFGGDDFLGKPVEPHHLVWTASARIERYRKVRGLMLRDGLTSLYNHSTLMEQLGKEASRASRSGEPLSFAMLDLDHFKQVNDTYGHAAGDRILKMFARLLTQRLRRSDTIGRYGGEEFAVILPNTDPQTAAELIDGIRDTFGRLTHFSDGQAFRATVSAGVDALSPEEPDASALALRADELLYKAKYEGRNRVIAGGG